MEFVGINAGDVNITAGKYTPDPSPAQELGAESVSEVIAVGEDCSYSVGDAVVV